jgi:hypothetical protein
LLTLTGALLAFIVLVDRPLRERRARESSRYVLPGLNISNVTEVDLTPWGQKKITARRSGANAHDWRLVEPVSYPANPESIEAFLKGLAELEWQDRIAASELLHRPDAEDKYGFSQPLYSVELRAPEGERRLAIGKASVFGDQLFVQVVGSYDIYAVSIELTNVIPRNKDHWRDRMLVDLRQMPIQTVQARSAGRSFELARDMRTGLWQMKKPVEARADSPKIDELLGYLDGLQVAWFAPDDGVNELDKYGLQTPGQTPQLEVTLLRDTNVLFDLQVGSNASGGLALARRADPSNVVALPVEWLTPWEADSTSFLDRHMFSLPPSEIASIDVAGVDHFTVRRATEGAWEVSTTNQTFQADPIFMADWLGGFTNVELAIEKMVVADLTPYGLAHPQLTYKLEGADGSTNKLLAQIEFGGAGAGGTFERRADESSVNIIPSGEYDRLPRVSWQMRDRQIWSFDPSNVVSVAVHYLGGDRKYLRDPLGQWTFAPGYHGPPFPNWPQLDEALYRLGRLRAVYWDGIGDDPTDSFGIHAADHRVTLEVKDNDKTETLQVEFGKRSPYRHPYAAVEKGGQRLIFEFPVDLFDGFVVPELTLPAALRQAH